MKRGRNIEDTITSLLQADMNISSINWHNILWDPVSGTMITNKLVLAETQLLQLAGHDTRTAKNRQNLEDLLNSRN